MYLYFGYSEYIGKLLNIDKSNQSMDKREMGWQMDGKMNEKEKWDNDRLIKKNILMIKGKIDG